MGAYHSPSFDYHQLPSFRVVRPQSKKHSLQRTITFFITFFRGTKKTRLTTKSGLFAMVYTRCIRAAHYTNKYFPCSGFELRSSTKVATALLIKSLGLILYRSQTLEISSRSSSLNRRLVCVSYLTNAVLLISYSTSKCLGIL